MVFEMRDPYSVLGVKKDAGADEIKAAWRSIVKSVHPDHNRDDPMATRRFAEIGEAYDLLRDPRKRMRYDQARQRAEEKQNEQTIMQQRAAAQEAAARAKAARENAERVMEELARQNARNAGTKTEAPGKGPAGASTGTGTGAGAANAHDNMFERIFGEKPPNRSASGQADTAAAAGSAPETATPGETPEEAAAARGSFLRFAASDLIASFVRRIRGTPEPTPEKLPDIMMEAHVTVGNLVQHERVGVIMADGREVKFSIEPGMTDGSVVTLKGQGLKVQGMPRGDLLLTLSVPRDSAFTVRGFDIHTTVSVSLEDAVLGCDVEIHSPHGPQTITVPPWSGSDRPIRIEGKGLVNAEGASGDLVAEIRIVLHEKPDDKVTDLMRHMREGLYL